MRLPMKCFVDFKDGGSLCHIFANMYRYKAEQRWRKFDFNIAKTSRKDKDPIKDMVTEIETALIENEFIRLPVVYIRPEVTEDVRTNIKEFLESHTQAEVTEEEECATHIIYPEVEISPEDYARPTIKRGKNAMMHWYYFPESYDSWVPIAFDMPVCELVQ